MPEILYRRSPALVTFWHNERLAYFNCQSGIRRTISMEVVEIVDCLTTWQTPSALCARYPELGTTREVTRLLVALERLTLVESKGRADHWIWSEWMPEAAFFHFGTRGTNYPDDLLAHETSLREKAKTRPQPRPTKTSRGPRRRLPAADTTSQLSRALLDRRTWRSFGHQPVPLEKLSTLLSLTWGVQHRGKIPGQGEVVLKTSPSGGARHPIEAYVIARSIKGLAPAVYHYDSATHELVRVAGRVADKRFVKVLANQYYFGDCAAAIVLTACVERTMWRYPFARAYRSILIEAGHLGQTFALLATAMQLAPFQTMAFRDEELESLLGLNDPGESAMYVLGVGTRNPNAIDQPGRIPPRKL